MTTSQFLPILLLQIKLIPGEIPGLPPWQSFISLLLKEILPKSKFEFLRFFAVISRQVSLPSMEFLASSIPLKIASGFPR